ncbi:MAG: PolC-type DNA polymerase III N-terminal domain-containing protein [Clostridia bacterium]
MKSKKVGEIFSDYKTNSNIKYAEVRALNVIKKTNILQVLLYFDEYIEIKEIWYFEKFLRERFMFSSVDIKIEYHEAVEKKGYKNRMEKYHCIYGT